MIVKTTFKLLLPALLLLAAQGNSQVITSKKEAERKGVYKKPVANSNEVSADAKSPVSAFTGNAQDRSTVKTTVAKPSAVAAAKPARQAAQKSKNTKALLN